MNSLPKASDHFLRICRAVEVANKPIPFENMALMGYAYTQELTWLCECEVEKAG